MFSCTVFLSPLILLRHIVPETGVLPAAYGCFLYFITNARCLADPVFTKTHSVFLPKCRRTHRVFRHRRNFQIFSRKHLHFPPESVRITLADGGIAQLGERMTGSHEVSGSIPLISTKTKSHSVRNGFFVLAGHTWREKRCGSTECIFAAQKRRFFCMQCRKHKKMQSARRRRSRRSIPLIVPLSFLENQPHFFRHAA